MTGIVDPIVRRQFEWTQDLDLAALMSDMTLLTRFMESYRDDPAYLPPNVERKDVLIDGPLGEFTLRLRVCSPPSEAPSPALVWAHGGGFAGGTLDGIESDAVAREICARGNVTVITVDYHVAGTDVAYPTLHDEVASAYRWATRPSELHNIDPNRILIGGASAGANLAIAATFEMRDKQEPLPAGIVLVYPLLYRRLPEDPLARSLDQLPDVLRIRQNAVDSMFLTYAGSGSASTLEYISAEGHSLAGLPPLFVVTAEFDDLRESGHVFAHHARAAGVTVSEHFAPGMAHGYLAMTPGIAETSRTLDLIAAYVKGIGHQQVP